MSQKKIRNMEEFAAVSGISRPTISKYFNDADSVRQSTRLRIEEALSKFDYKPNIFAINQNRSKTKNIGIIVPYLADPFFAEIGRAVELACLDAGYRPILLNSHGSPALEKSNLESLKSLKPSGVLLAPLGKRSDRKSIQTFNKDVPLVLFDANIEDTGQAFIGMNNMQSVGLMVDYLCRSGQPPSFFEMKTPSNPNAAKRRQAYLDSMEKNGLPAHIFQAEGEGWDFEQIGQAEGSRLLSKNAFPTNTVLCSNDRLAIGLLSAAYHLKHSVGRDAKNSIRIAGHDDHPFSRFTCPPLTTIAQDYSAISTAAVTALFKVIESENGLTERETFIFEGKLIMRDSA